MSQHIGTLHTNVSTRHRGFTCGAPSQGAVSFVNGRQRQHTATCKANVTQPSVGQAALHPPACMSTHSVRCGHAVSTRAVPTTSTAAPLDQQQQPEIPEQTEASSQPASSASKVRRARTSKATTPATPATDLNTQTRAQSAPKQPEAQRKLASQDEPRPPRARRQPLSATPVDIPASDTRPAVSSTTAAQVADRNAAQGEPSAPAGRKRVPRSAAAATLPAAAAVATAAAAATAVAAEAASNSKPATDAKVSQPSSTLSPDNWQQDSSGAPEPAPASIFARPAPPDSRDQANLESDLAFVATLRERAVKMNSSTLADIAGELEAIVSKATKGDHTSASGYCARLYRVMFGAGSKVDLEGHAEGHGEEGGQTKSQQEYVPEVEVVVEVVQGSMGLRLPQKAYYGNRARELAKLSIEQCKEQCKLWMNVCGPNYARFFLDKEPRLLLTRPEALLTTLESVQQGLGMGEDKQGTAATVEWALRNSSLISSGINKERLDSCLSEVQSVLGVDRFKAQAALRRWTMLLTYQPGDLQRRFDVLAALLPVDPAKFAAGLRKRPQVLARHPSALAQSLVALAALTKVPLSSAAVMVAAQIGLCGVAADRLEARWERITNLANRHDAWRSQLSSMLPQQVARCLTVPEGNVSRLAFVLKYQLQDFPAAQDMKRLVTMSQTAFENQLMNNARLLRNRNERARAAEAGQAADGPSPALAPSQSPIVRLERDGRLVDPVPPIPAVLADATLV